MSDPVVEVKHASKRFCRDLKLSLWYGVKDIATGLCGRSTGGTELRFGEFWAVNDVSFELRRGECLGLIGANGAGKSTLLKMLNGLIKPDTGRITMRGRIGALIELGAGFHPLLSGRENIYVNASILGMSKRETDVRLNDIIAFADIGDAIDAPVKSYSSGMRVRLGFAVAAHLEPDVLLVDEVLAVGDLAFRLKCYQSIAELRRAGTALILVSHSEQLVKATCDRGLVLCAGRTVFVGDVDDAFTHYRETKTSQSGSGDPAGSLPSRVKGESTGGPQIVDVQWMDSAGHSLPRLVSGKPASLFVTVHAPNSCEDVGLFVGVRSVDSPELMAAAFLTTDSLGEIDLASSATVLRMSWNACCLAPGKYDLKLRLEKSPFEVLDIVDWGTLQFDVGSDSTSASQIGLVYQPHRWEIQTLGDADEGKVAAEFMQSSGNENA